MNWMAVFSPSRAARSWLARGQHPLRSSIGAWLGMGTSLALGTWAMGAFGASAALVAPIGASAVLVFAVPASPLAQPRAVLGGNLVSALIGMLLARVGLEPWLVLPLAVGLAILAMHALRCLHPPGGAMALVAAMGAHGAPWPWTFLLSPAASNTLALLAAGWLFNNCTGSRYPHHNETLPEHGVPMAIDYDPADLATVLDELEDRPDISTEDLDSIVRAVFVRHAMRKP
ncbi:CBS domain-containing membrane protein [Novosphingobium sp. SG916]|nr:CBS domain-containing membrane protein [Novosphingobium sp. SG919]NMN88943.1 CBS domain-containing membrane protein [Novosphingobium sp. SG916]